MARNAARELHSAELLPSGTVVSRLVDWLPPMIPPFLDTPMPEGE
jgi:hypothetical protein